MTLLYLDNAATTPLHPEVRAAMAPYLEAEYGNPSSMHAAGRRARQAVEKAREQLAKALGAPANDIVFTSGGTESDNSAIVGAVLANRAERRHIVTTTIEHHAVLQTCEFLEKMGCEVTYISPDSDGIVKKEEVLAAIRPDTAVVSVMYVNNETGAIQPVEEIAHACAEQGVLFHTDAVQAVGLLPIDVKAGKIDMLSLSGHKLHGPKGIGALYVRRDANWHPILHGGSQERKRRAGTENVAGIVGLGAAIERMVKHRRANYEHILALKHRMLDILKEEVDFLVVNSPEQSVPSIVSVSFPGVSADTMLMNLDMAGIAAASGSACTSGSLQPSHVLTAMNLEPTCVKSAIRFSFSEQTTLEEVETAAYKTAAIANKLKRR
ncbi:cysteine desulfurase family protein [Effusibacillus lacus]|uniref:cysteine desulfurase n=1 Tax=Effusibacillus lacus TaxID=1348429 RepID=A0A292YN36_9BACL|nr:cysteine desulfurase family protein [Effusibacillus lacus]TCS72029.1 cysteine desulfurase [Effusibacillus lacus]GAX90321.1 cysteine desulfurase [Effusibacillus lacus]